MCLNGSTIRGICENLTHPELSARCSYSRRVGEDNRLHSSSDRCVWTTFSVGFLECKINVKESMVRLSASSAPAEGRELLRVVTKPETVHTEIVLFDCFNHSVMRHGLEMSASIKGCFSVLHTTQFGLVVNMLATNKADL